MREHHRFATSRKYKLFDNSYDGTHVVKSPIIVWDSDKDKLTMSGHVCKMTKENGESK
jgi:hypothetical protein